VLRICGGIFTKIADIGSDLMKIVFKLPEDDPKNPGVIADCTGDNAGDSVGPTADGFETYGVTGVALIAFLALALDKSPAICATLIIWLFTMRALMIVTSLVSYFVNEGISKAMFGGKKDFDFFSTHPATGKRASCKAPAAEPAESAEPVQRTDPSGSTESAQPTDPSRLAEPTEPTQQQLPAEPEPPPIS